MSKEDNKEMGVSETLVSTAVSISNSSSCSSVAEAAGEKRSVPLLYVQSPTNKPSPINGIGSKFVHIQPAMANPSIAYVGTIIKAGMKGQEPVAQKVLLTPVKTKDGSVKRFILPRTTSSTVSCGSAVNVVVPQGLCKPAVCKSYVIQPSVKLQGKIQSSVKTQAPLNPAVSLDSSVCSSSKSSHPNIIRQKNSESKVSSNSTNSSIAQLLARNVTVTSTVSGPSVTTEVMTKSAPIKSLLLPLESKAITGPKVSSVVTSKSESAFVSVPKLTSGCNYQLTLSKVPPSASSTPVLKTIDKEVSLEVVPIDDEGVDSKSKIASRPVPALEPLYNKTGPLQNGHNDFTKFPSRAFKEEVEIVKETPILPPTERARKRKGQLSNEKIKHNVSPWQGEGNKILPGAEEYDPFQVIEWNPRGMGKLPGSEIKFVMNEFGMLDLYDTLQTKTQHSIEDSVLKRIERDPDEIFCCVSCSCYGLISEFYNENFCSKTCRDNHVTKQSNLKKKNFDFEDAIEIKRKRNILQMTLQSRDKRDSKDSSEAENSVDDPRNLKGSESEEVIDVDEDSSTTPPMFTEAILKKQTKNDNEYNRQLIKVQKIIKKGVKIGGKVSKTTITHKTYSKGDKKSKFHLKSKEIDEKDFCDTSEYQEPEINSRKQDIKKRNNSTDSSSDKGSQRDIEDFDWNSYLAETHSRSAWVKLFHNPFPTLGNTFRVGYKLEAIDPEHQAYVCAASVSQIKGYRLKIHFDGYSKAHDFWTNADSPNIFPCGYASRNGLTLQPPWGYKAVTFSWHSYTSSWKAKAAPPSCFPNHRISITSPNLFRVGMKMEAVDRKNSFLICVATVAAVLDNRILVHFDSWGDVYDYWADTSSPYIHPIGWCKAENHELTPPNGIKPSEFNWDKYLKETGSVGAPARAFRLRPHVDFKKGSKIEAVDKRSPHLLRVATIKDVLPYQIRIGFDGFPDHFGYWVDDDSPDVHPIGWGSKTGHPIEPPPPDDDSSSPCPTPGCFGQGHARGRKFETHSAEEDCPYSIDNINNDDLIPDRLIEKPCIFQMENDDSPGEKEFIDLDRGEESDDEDIKSKRWKWLGVREQDRGDVATLKLKKNMTRLTQPKVCVSEVEDEKPDIKPVIDNISEESGAMKSAMEELSLLVDTTKPTPMSWTPEEVFKFCNNLLNKECMESILKEDIDGQAFLMLWQKDLVDYLGFKLGDAIKLHNAITLLREKVT